MDIKQIAIECGIEFVTPPIDANVGDYFWGENAKLEAFAKAIIADLSEQKPVAVRARYAGTPHKWHHAGINDTIEQGYLEIENLYLHPYQDKRNEYV